MLFHAESRPCGQNSTKYGGSSEHAEQALVRKLKAAKPKLQRNKGQGMRILVMRGDRSCGTSKPCARCTALLKQVVPNAVCGYCESGSPQVVWQAVHRIIDPAPTRRRRTRRQMQNLRVSCKCSEI